jgi:hypothetical protein
LHGTGLHPPAWPELLRYAQASQPMSISQLADMYIYLDGRVLTRPGVTVDRSNPRGVTDRITTCLQNSHRAHDKMACSSTYSVLEILKTESLPLQELELSINECLCKAVYGVGSADLTGIGVSGLIVPHR